MDQPHFASNREQIVDTMVELTRLSNQHRTIIAGSDSLEFCLAPARFRSLGNHRDLPHSRAKACRRPDHEPKFPTGDRALCQCRNGRPHRLP
jgi:hypothetical protein